MSLASTNIIMHNDVVFSLKLRQYINKSQISQYLFIFLKYLPLFMISHDIYLHKSMYINKILSYLTLKILIKNPSNSIIPDVLVFIILFILLLFFFLLFKLYKQFNNKNDFCSLKTDKNLMSYEFSVLFCILVTFNQNLYELLFSSFLCEGKVDEVTRKVSLSLECYTPIRYITIAIGICLILCLVIINYYFSLVFLQPWFSSDCIIPTAFNENNLIWTFLPLLQGYITIEANIPSDYVYIVRYVIRCIFILYMINFYIKIPGLVYSNKKSLSLIIFMNSFNFFSILFEFIPFIADELSDVRFVVIKLILQGVLSYIVLFFFLAKEERLLSNNNRNHEGGVDPLFYENFNKYFYLLGNFEQEKNQKILEMLINQFLENLIAHKKKGKNEDISRIFSRTKLFFNVAKYSSSPDANFLAPTDEEDLMEIMNVRIKFQQNFSSKFTLISDKLNYVVNFIDEIFLDFLSNERQSEEVLVKITFLYSIFCNLLKRNHVSALFFLEKICKYNSYNTSFLLRLYYADIKNQICEDHYTFRIKDVEEKIYLKKFYMNIKHYDSLTLYLRKSVESFKNMLYGINKKNISLENFNENIKEVSAVLNNISIENNEHLKEVLCSLNNNIENNIMINKYKIVNEFIFGLTSNEKITFKEIPEDKDHIKSMKEMHINDVFMILHLDENENIIIDKVENRLLTMLNYEHSDLEGQDLLFLIPRIIAKYHKKKTTYFTQSNKDFRTLEIFFITRDRYALPFMMTCIILPMLGSRILFLSCFEQISHGEVRLSTPGEFKTTFTCFLEIARNGQIVTINKEFEKIFGINNDLIQSSSNDFNFLTKILKLNPDRIFNRTQLVQHYETRIAFKEVFLNIKKINLDNFREYSLEAFYKLKNFFLKFNIKRYENTILKISLERRIINPDDNDYFFCCKMNIDQTIPTSLSYNKVDINKLKSGVEMIKMEFQLGEKDKKTLVLTNEIYKMSTNMLKEGSLLWKGRVSYSDIADHEKMLEAFNINKTNELNCENGLWAAKQTKRKFEIKHFLLFICLSVSFQLFYAFTYLDIMNDYSKSINFNNISNNIITLKYDLVMIAFSLLETYVSVNKKMPSVDNGVLELQMAEMKYYISTVTEALYKNEKMSLDFNDADYKSTIFSFLSKSEVYKTVHYDLSIYERNFTLFDSVEWFRYKVTQYDNFDNLTFDTRPSEFKDPLNGNLYDINKKKFSEDKLTSASEGDLTIYFLINNFVDKTIPLYDSLIQTNQDILKDFTATLIKKAIIIFSCLFAFLFLICIYLFFYFYSGKRHIYERYFINFNIFKFFTPYLLFKLKSLEDLLIQYTKENYDFYKGLDYDINIGNVRASFIKFELENNNLTMINKSRIKKSSPYNVHIPRNLKYLSMMNREDEKSYNNKIIENKNKRRNSDMPSSPINRKKGKDSNYNSDKKLNIDPQDIVFGNYNSLHSQSSLHNVTKSNIKRNSLFSSPKSRIKSYNLLNDNSKSHAHDIRKENLPKIVISPIIPFEEKPSVTSTQQPGYNIPNKFLFNSSSHVDQILGNSILDYNSQMQLERMPTNLSNKSNNTHLQLSPVRSNLRLNIVPEKSKKLSYAGINNSNFVNTADNLFLSSSSNLSRINSNNYLMLPSESNPKSPIALLSSQVQTTNQNMEKVNEQNILEEHNDFIHPRNLLGKKSSFYFDFYFVLFVIALFFLLNTIFFILTYKYINDVNKINYLSSVSLQVANSQIEISLIYMTSLLRGREIVKQLTNDYNWKSRAIFLDKIDDYANTKSSLLTLINSNYYDLFPSLINYHKNLNGNNACSSIFLNDQLFQNNSNDTYVNFMTKNCETKFGGLFQDGLYLAFDSLANNFLNDYNEHVKLEFINTKGFINDINLYMVFQSHRDILAKNIMNVDQLIKIETEAHSDSVISNISLYFGLFFVLSLLLMLSYCIVYMFIKRNFELLINLESILMNVLK